MPLSAAPIFSAATFTSTFGFFWAAIVVFATVTLGAAAVTLGAAADVLGPATLGETEVRGAGRETVGAGRETKGAGRVAATLSWETGRGLWRLSLVARRRTGAVSRTLVR